MLTKVIEDLEKRGVTLEAVADIVYQLQRAYYPDLRPLYLPSSIRRLPHG